MTILGQIDEAYSVRSWHGTNLKGSLRALAPDVASWRPGPGRHNIHELVVHAAYWKYAVRRRLEGDARGSFGEKGSNWFPREGAGATLLRADIALLGREHTRLRAAILGLKDSDLRRRSGRGTVGFLLRGIAAHDLYHAGQIQLLKRLCPY